MQSNKQSNIIKLMTKNKKLLISILAVAVILAAGWWIWESQKIPERLSYERCLKLEAEISEDVSSIDNSCEIDSDCKPLNFGGNWMNICVNKNTNTLAVQSAVKNFLMKCPFPGVWPPVDECSCVENKCATIIKKPQEVTIATDKTEYEQGETVKFSLVNNFPKSIWYVSGEWNCNTKPYEIYNFSNNAWSRILTYAPICSDVVGAGAPIYKELLSNNSISLEWNQNQWDYYTETYSAQAGKYKISMRYKENKDAKIPDNTIYSNEFTIKEKQSDVTITTDKTEYEQGEVIKVAVENNIDEDLFLLNFRFESLQVKEDNSWVYVKNSIMHGMSPKLDKKISTKDKITENVFSYELFTYGEYPSSDSYYRLAETVYFQCKNIIDLDECNKKTIYSNEFKFKGKSAVDPRCSQKAKGIGFCRGFWEGYEFDQNLGKCVKTGASGCDAKIPFSTLEECQRVCENECFTKIPITINLPAVKTYSSSVIDSDYVELRLPKNLCINSYPLGIDGYYIVQFKGPVYEDYKNQVKSQGGVIYDYIPKNAFIVKMGEGVKDKIQNLESVKWVGIYQAAYKMPDSLIDSLNRTGNITLTVGFFAGENAEDITNKIKSLGGNILATWEHKGRIAIDASKMPDIANILGIQFVEEYKEPEIF